MKTALNYILIAPAFILLLSCTFNATRANMQEDKEDGEKVANRLFAALRDNNYTEADKLFSEELYKAIPLDSMHRIFDTTAGELGAFKNNKLAEWETLDVSGTDSRTEYFYVYDVEYEKYNAKVIFGMLKKKDEEDIKIMKYHIESLGFLQ